jgi:type II secretory pathway pseudopilin PulG
MEVLVVLAVFSTISVAVADLFLISSRAERRAGSVQQVQADARSALEYMVSEVRTSSVAYSRLPAPLASPLAELIVSKPDGRVYGFAASSDPARCGQTALPCLLVTLEENGASESAPLTPADLAVRDLKFYVTPAEDPFLYNPATGAYAADEEPLVTIVLSLVPVGHPEQSVAVQTTVATRNYVR